jgi:hypothetical protein
MNPDSPSRYEGIQKNNSLEGSEWTGQITVCFSHAHAGWVLLWIATTSYLQHITLHLTDIYNPFLVLFDWLEAVAADRLPAEINIDEEGIAKTLYAASAEDGLIYFQIMDRYQQDQVLWGCRCDRRQLIAEFSAKFELFLQSYYQEDGWRFPPGPLAVDLSSLKAYLKG